MMTQNKQYDWAGMFLSGEATRGSIEANSVTLAKSELRRQGIIALKIVKKRTFLFKTFRRITPLEITAFSRQLITLIKAGMPLNHSLNLLSINANNPRLKVLIQALRSDVENGLMLSSALSKYPDCFNRLFCNMVKAGEQSGAIDTMLLKIVEYRENTANFRKKLHKVMAYPLVVTVIALLVTAILLTWVIPQFDRLFNSFDAQLPILTQYVIHLSNFLKNWCGMIICIVLAIVYGVVCAYKHLPEVSKRIDRLYLNLPIIGKIARNLSISRFSRTLSITSTSGLPLNDALQLVSGVIGGGLYAQATHSIREKVIQGQSIHSAIENTQLFPAMVIQLISVGEESGTLEQMLTKIADFYDEEVNSSIETLSSLLEPVIMTILGLFIGGLVVAMYLPMLKLGTII